MLEGWGVPLAVLGMLLATLFMAAILKGYQTHQAYVRVAVRRLESGAVDIADAMQAMQPVPLSQELRVAMYAEVLARWVRIRRLYRRFPDIAERIRSTELALQAQGPGGQGSVGAIDGEQAFRRLTVAFDVLAGVVSHGDTAQPIPADVRAIFLRELGERRAEATARFHLVQSRQLETAGNPTKARAHLTTLLHVLSQRGPATQFVRQLHSEAEAALAAFTGRQFGDVIGAPAGAPPDSRRSA